MDSTAANNTQGAGLIGVFARHPVACNLLMIIMIMAGIFGLLKLNKQFFPNFDIDYININVVWRGASAEDVERSITQLLEDEFRSVKSLRKITSTSVEGMSSIYIEYEQGSDLDAAQDEVNEKLGQIRNLPAEAEKPQVTKLEREEIIARVVVASPQGTDTLRPLVKRFERELLDTGINSIELVGLPDDEIAIQVPQTQLHELGIALPELAARIRSQSIDLPAGSAGRADASRQLRSIEQRRSAMGFENLAIQTGSGNHLLKLGDIAEIERRPARGQATVSRNGQPAIQMNLLRAQNDDALTVATLLDEWLKETLPTLPPEISVAVYDEQWEPIADRISLLLKNGLSGLLLIVAILFLFLNGRVAFWVTVGIPVSFLATLMVLYVLGGSINMISLFALIMALGIIVDDAIVVGEDALTHYQAGEAAAPAAIGGAKRMFWPVLSSSLTTIAAFIPLMIVGDYIGAILFAIPLVIICVIIASLVECFLIMPGHLRKSFQAMGKHQPGKTRQRLDRAFDHFRDRHFRPLVQLAIRFRAVTFALALASFILALGLVAGGKVKFSFFPTPEIPVLFGNVQFVAGTPPERVAEFLNHVEEKLWETDAELGPGLVNLGVVWNGIQMAPGNNFFRSGDQYGLVVAELVEPDQREVRNEAFMQAWKAKLTLPAALERFSTFAPTAGPPGRGIELRLTTSQTGTLKQAAEALASELATLPGVLGIDDDMPWGREQLIYSLTPAGEALGLTVAAVGQQLRANFDGELVQIFQDQGDDIDVRVMLPNAERDRLANLDTIPLLLPNGNSVPLGNVVSFRTERGFERIRHEGGRRAILVSADVDEAAANASELRSKIDSDIMPRLREQYGVDWSWEGQGKDQAETMADMLLGAVYALLMIYLVLAWVFGSYGWPLIVMSIIPFGLTGAILGHWVMGLDLTILSLFGFFGLSGIVVNDSIILVVFYKELRAKGMAIHEALVEAAGQRLRAVMLTSLTTIGGLTPLMFETSLQATFLIPMAASITFGLAFATLLVLVLVPSLLSVYEDVMQWLKTRHQNRRETRAATLEVGSP